MKQLTIKVQPNVLGKCLMTGEQSDGLATIEIQTHVSNKGLTALIDLLTALKPPEDTSPAKEKKARKRGPVQAKPDASSDICLDDDIPF